MHVGLCCAGPNLRAIMLNVNPPETRGVALALQSVTDDLGKGLGPVIVAGAQLVTSNWSLMTNGAC